MRSLKDAIAEYVEAHSEEDDFAVETEAIINEEDEYADADVVSFKTPVEPIKINSMKVTKW